jgi:hypothetical protein
MCIYGCVPVIKWYDRIAHRLPDRPAATFALLAISKANDPDNPDIRHISCMFAQVVLPTLNAALGKAEYFVAGLVTSAAVPRDPSQVNESD